jgi:hypothetical protein
MAYGIPHTIWTQAPSFLSVSWLGCNCSSHRRSIPPRCEGRRGRDASMTAEWDAGKTLSSAASGSGRDYSRNHVIRRVPTYVGPQLWANARAWSHGGGDPHRRSGGCSVNRRAGRCGSQIGPVAEPRRCFVFVPVREVCEYWPIAGQAVLRRPHCCLPHTVCNVVTSKSARRSTRSS